MFDYHLLYLLPIVFLAYFCKATTGFGAAIILLPLGSLVIGPIPALMLATLLDVIGGVALLRIDSTRDSWRLWLPLGVAMMLGAGIGGLLLKFVALRNIDYFLGVTLFIVGVWLIFFRLRQRAAVESAILPDSYTGKDLAVCLLAGTSGGLTGVSGPPLMYYFGKKFAKESLRKILTRIFLAEAMARVATYIVVGVAQPGIILLGLLATPFLYLGLYAGNHVFFRIPEIWFSRVAGVVVIASALKLMW
ncbi:MAG: TSUP family transporter [Blastocatellia bacterium]